MHGVYWLSALDDEGPIGALDAAARRDALHLRVKLLAVAMRSLADHVNASGTFLMTATRLGGRHGYDTKGACSVLGGAVSGFTKALSQERPDALVKVVDFGADGDSATTAETLIQETLRDPGAVEIGHADGLRWSVATTIQDAEHDPAREPDSTTVFLVTGAAGSIVSAITADLAAASGGGTFHLLDLVPAPDSADPDLGLFATDRQALQRVLADRIREHGERPTPKLIERELARIERAVAALAAISAIERAGGQAHWHQVDLTDAEQVARAIAQATRISDRIDVVMHCAGLDISHFLPDKPQSEYDLVFDVKAHGWLNLLAALADQGLTEDKAPDAAIVFSSIAGRFGNIEVRPTTRPQTTCSARASRTCAKPTALVALRSTGPHGLRSAWRAAARSRR